MSWRRALAILGRERGAVAALSLAVIPLGLAGSGCLIGLPILVYGFGKLAAVLVSGARGSSAPVTGSVRAAGILAVLALAVLAGAMVVGGSLSALTAAPWTAWIGAFVAAVITGAALAPLALAPFAVIDGRVGFFASLPASFALGARLGARRLAVLGAIAGGLVGGALLAAFALFHGAVEGDLAEHLAVAILAAPAGILPGPPIAGALLADAYVEASSGAPLPLDRTPSLRLRALALVLVPAILLVLGAVTTAALTPTPMRPLPMEAPVRRGIHGEGITVSPQHRSLGGAEVRTGAHGVVIEAPDGGGAGEIDARFDTRESALLVEPGERYGGADGSFAVIVTNGDAWAFTLVSAGGVRQDDDLTTRILGRLGGVMTLVLFAGLVLVLILSFQLASDLGEARALSAPDLRDGGRRGVLAALECTLRLVETAELRMMDGVGMRVKRGRLVPRPPFLSVRGDAWLETEGGALRFRIPEGYVPALGPAVEVRDGSPVVLLSRFDRVTPAGLRESASPWPPDARLVLGTRRDATAALVRRASTIAAWIAVPALAALIAAAGSLLSAL